jgi:hypothetical protein
MIAKIVHTAKQTVNAMVESHRAARWSAGRIMALDMLILCAEAR